MVSKSPAEAAGLTRRQREVIELLVEGYSNLEIADRLGISLDGAKWHVSEILARLDVGSREEAAERWLNRRQRRLYPPRRVWAIALSFPLKAVAALAELLRPGPSERAPSFDHESGGGDSAITERWEPPAAQGLARWSPIDGGEREHIRDPSPPDALFDVVLPDPCPHPRTNNGRREVS